MLELRQITDIETLLPMRMEVIRSVFGDQVPDEMDALEAANRQYYERRLADGTHVACLAYEDGTLCGSGAICLQDELPSPDNPSGRCAYIMSVYVRPAHRHRGIARQIIRWLITRARALGADKIYLESTILAAPLYHTLGFRDMLGMMKYHPDEE